MIAPDSPRWISEAEVVEMLSLREAIDALAEGLKREASGSAQNMVKTHAAWPVEDKEATLHAIGAVFTPKGYEHGFVGTKTWAHTPGGATPLFALFDASTGKLLAMIEAFAFGQMRTAGISGLATRYMASEDANELAIIGTGKQALPQVAAVHCVRPLKRVRVFSRTPEKREAFAAKLRENFDFEVVVAESVAEAAKNAPIVTLVTRATSAFIGSAEVAKGAHINAVGAITPEREEFHQDIFPRAARMAADSVDSVRRLSAEFRTRMGEDDAHWAMVEPLSKLVAEDARRPGEADLTLFKAMGMGISDLSLASEIYARALGKNLGHKFPHPEKVPIRFS
ncbi:MAG: ornithine cyclodeaminase family protein [Chrysiogenetes bacterium]|nr:ornithine cyclodeaminase family protein [Chrysiogenetes bacterium]